MPTLKTPEWFADLESNGLLGHDPWESGADTVWMFAAFIPDKKRYILFVKDEYLTPETLGYCEDYPHKAESLRLHDRGEYTLDHHYAPVDLFKLSKLKQYLKDNKPLMAIHNGIKYDSVVLKRVEGIKVKPKKLVDTLVLSQLSDPDRFPGHSLAVWGEKFGIPKPEHEDWLNFSLGMIHRCLQDCYITYRTWKAVSKELSSPEEAALGVDWKEAVKLEHQVAHIIAESEELGFPFNKELATEYLKVMKYRRDELDAEIKFDEILLPSKGTYNTPEKDFVKVFSEICDLNIDEWSHFLTSVGIEERQGWAKPVSTIFKANGEPTTGIIKWWASDEIPSGTGKFCIISSKKEFPKDYIQDVPDIVGPYSRVSWESVSPTSNVQLIKMLLNLGWEPLERTDKGSPRITEESLDKFVIEHPQFTNLKERIVTEARIRTMKNEKDDQKGLINLVLDNGTIPSINNTLGANTHRSRHKKVVNTPSVDSLWGYLFRNCFHSLPYDGEEGFSFERGEYDEFGNKVIDKNENHVHTTTKVSGRMALIGADAQALESRLLGAFMGDDDFIKEVLEGDIHTVFLDTVKEYVSSRRVVKGVEYAFIFGAAALKIGSMVDKGRDSIKESDAKRKGWKKIGDLWTTDYRIKKGWEPLSWKDVLDTLLGTIVINRFLKGLPALGKLVNDLKDYANKYKMIKGIDGRRFKVRKAHAVLNLKIQSTGAIIMKRALVIAHKKFKKAGIPWYLHCFYHDEYNFSVPPPNIKEASHILEQSIRDAGEYYNLKCPMDAKAHVGLTWADVH